MKQLTVFVLVEATLIVSVTAATMKDDIAACAVALSPEITIMNASSSLKKSWLRLITETTYESAKQQIQTSGSVDLLGLIGANGSFTYDQFNEKRRQYLNLDVGEIQDERAVSIFRQVLPPRAGEHFVQCVNIAAMGGSGLRAWFSDETADFAILHIKFRGSPQTRVEFKTSISGGTGIPTAASLPHDGEGQYNIKRGAKAPELRVVLTSTNPPGLADSAISVRPSPTAGPPKPMFIPDQVWSLSVASTPQNCKYTISNKDLRVMAYDVPAEGRMALRIRGKDVIPDAGDFPIAPAAESDYSILAVRALSDFELGPSSEVLLIGPGGAHATLMKTPAVIAGCSRFTLAFASARIVVQQPAAVYTESTESYTETLDYKRSGDYTHMLGSVGCPDCGDLYAADLVHKLGRPVARIEAVTFLKQGGSSHWYRCYSVAAQCETDGETTRTQDRKSGTCVGKNTCFSWRFSTAGLEATDTYTLQYKARLCLRYCRP